MPWWKCTIWIPRFRRARAFSNSQNRVAVAAGPDCGLSKPSAKPCSACLCSFWIFAYSVQGRPGQPFPGFLSQLGGIAQPELLFHAHLMGLNRLDAYIQLTR